MKNKKSVVSIGLLFLFALVIILILPNVINTSYADLMWGAVTGVSISLFGALLLKLSNAGK